MGARYVLDVVECVRHHEGPHSISMPKTKITEYTAADIQVLEGLEAVRRRPSLYIGSTDSRGLHHLVYEIVDNSIDEAMAGFCNAVDVRIQKDGSVVVTDNGRRIPI